MLSGLAPGAIGTGTASAARPVARTPSRSRTRVGPFSDGRPPDRFPPPFEPPDRPPPRLAPFRPCWPPPVDGPRPCPLRRRPPPPPAAPVPPLLPPPGRRPPAFPPAPPPPAAPTTATSTTAAPGPAATG